MSVKSSMLDIISKTLVVPIMTPVIVYIITKLKIMDNDLSVLNDRIAYMDHRLSYMEDKISIMDSNNLEEYKPYIT